MKRYRAKLKHDNGVIWVKLIAQSYAEAVETIKLCEKCPESAIREIKCTGKL